MHKKVVKKICNIALDVLIVICGIVLLVSIYNNVQVKIFKKDYADFFGYSTFEVQTGSMTPAINVSDLIIVKKTDSPSVRDIITYKKDGEFITHRVVEAYKETYVTKGDANNSNDEAITKNQIVGKVVKIIPHFGIMRKTILNPVVLVTLLVTAYIIGLLFKEKDSKNGVDKFFTKLLHKASKEDNSVKEEKTLVSVNTVSQVQDSSVEEAKAILESMENNPEDMDKTIYFRKISVDSSELNQKVVIPEEVEEEKEEIVIKEINVENKVEELKKRKRKFKNLIDKVVFIKEEEINELVAVLNTDRVKPNEPSIKDAFLKSYIDAKYYNNCGDINISYNGKNESSKLEAFLESLATKMIKTYNGTDRKYSEKVLKYRNIFMMIVVVDHINKLYDDVELKKAAYQKKFAKVFDSKTLSKVIGKIISIQKAYSKILSDSLEIIDSNTFELQYNQLTSKKNLYGLVLKHNINFSKVYSDYIIDKTYDEGIVAEDKVLVTINILYNVIADNMLNNNLKNSYLLYLPATLYEKENKLSRVLSLLDDEACKTSVIFVIKYSVLIKNKKLIKELKKQGYRFAIYFDEEIIKEKDQSIIGIGDYIFADKKVIKNTNLSLFVDKTSIVIENILTKVDISGGE